MTVGLVANTPIALLASQIRHSTHVSHPPNRHTYSPHAFFAPLVPCLTLLKIACVLHWGTKDRKSLMLLLKTQLISLSPKDIPSYLNGFTYYSEDK